MALIIIQFKPTTYLERINTMTIRRVKVSDKNKELLNKATDGDIYLDPNTTYYAKVTITKTSQIVEIENTPFTITLPRGE